MRLFIGLEVPLHLKNHIHKFLLPIHLSGKGWENPHDYHQTLLFIGETPEDEVSRVMEKMDSVEFHPFELKLSHFQFFNRRIMYLGLHPSKHLIELKELIDEAFFELSEKETKQFIPHITVKRWQRYEYDHLISELEKRNFEEKSFIVNELSLFKSEKDALDRKYHIIYSKPF